MIQLILSKFIHVLIPHVNPIYQLPLLFSIHPLVLLLLYIHAFERQITYFLFLCCLFFHSVSSITHVSSFQHSCWHPLLCISLFNTSFVVISSHLNQSLCTLFFVAFHCCFSHITHHIHLMRACQHC